MISKGVFTENLPISIENELKIEESVSQLLSMIDYSKKFETNYFVCEDSLYGQTISDMDFGTWLYDYTDHELRDVKKELSIYINKAETLDSSVNFTNLLGEETIFIIGKNKNVYIWNTANYLFFKQSRLKNISSRSLFAREARECFINIFFTDEVSSSLRTLGKDFGQIRGEIILHLRKLDEYYDKFQEKLTDGCNFQSLADTFTAYSGISCSPQAGRDGVGVLTKSFTNYDTGVIEYVVCELHTKFDQHNRGRQKPDRIYFHPGKKGVCDGKIIVIHIGAHI